MPGHEDQIKTKLALEGEKEYREACKGINTSLREIGSEMKLVSAQYDGNAKSTEALTSKKKLLQKQLEEQSQKVKAAEDALRQMREAGLEATDPAVQKMQTSLNNAKSEMVQTENQIRQMDQELGKSKVNWQAVGQVVGEAAKVFGKALLALGTAAVGAAAGLAGLTVSASNYADDLLTQSTFTRQSTTDLQKYAYAARFVDVEVGTLTKSMAKNIKSMDGARSGNKKTAAAYKTLGVSVTDSNGNLRDSNEVYWECIDALGQVQNETERDALAMTLFGKSAQELNSVIEAGSGAFKQLGDEAEAMGFILSEQSVQALGAFNDKLQVLEAGMDGLKNAASLIALPFLDVLATDGISVLKDFSKGIQDAGGDVTKMGDVVGQGLAAVVGVISKHLPGFVDMGVKMISSLIKGIVDNLPQITSSAVEIAVSLCNGLLDMLPMILEGAVQIVVGLAEGIAAALPQLTPKVVEIITHLVQTLIDNIPLLIGAALNLITGLADGLLQAIPVLVAAVPSLILGLLDAFNAAIPQIIQVGVQLFTSLVENLPAIITSIVAALPQIITGIVNAFASNVGLIIEAGVQLFTALITNLPQIISAIVGAIPQIITAMIGAFQSVDWSGIWDGIVTAFSNVDWAGLWAQIQALFAAAWEQIKAPFTTAGEWASGIWTSITGAFADVGSWFTTAFSGAWTSITGAFSGAAEWAAGVWNSITQAFSNVLITFSGVGKDVVNGVWQGIQGLAGDLTEKVKGFFSGIVDGVKGFLGIHSPSTVFAGIGGNMADGVGQGFGENMSGTESDMKAAMGGAGDATAAEAVKAVNAGIMAHIGELSGAINAIVNAVSTGLAAQQAALVLIGGDFLLGIAQGITASVSKLTAVAPTVVQQLISAFVAQHPKFVTAGGDIQKSIAQGMVATVSELTGKVPRIVQAVITAFVAQHPKFVTEGNDLDKSIASGMVSAINEITGKVPQIVQSTITAFVMQHSKLTQEGTDIDRAVASGMVSASGEVSGKVPQIMNAVVSAIKGFKGQFTNAGEDMVRGIWDGFQAMKGWLESKVRAMMRDIVAAVKQEMQINSPSKVFAEIGGFLAQGLGKGFEAEMRGAEKLIRRTTKGATPSPPPKSAPKGSGTGGGFSLVQNIYTRETNYAAQQREARRNFTMVARELMA